jgi:4-hydroxyphenylpyruvate dioxygenase-like putative hemolysin
MLDTDQIKETLERELEELHQARQQLLFVAQVDHVELRVHWDQIDDALRFARAEINRLGDDSEEAAREIEATSRRLLDDVRARVHHIRSTRG